jgi:type I restriction enzyme S subunit
MGESKVLKKEWIDNLPIGWKKGVLKRVLVGIKDGTHGTFLRTAEGEYLLSAKNITEKGIVLSEEESLISVNDYDAIVSNGYPKKGDILMCIVGTIGRCCVYNENKPLAFQRSVAFLRCDTNKCVPEYIKYILMSKISEDSTALMAHGSAQMGLYLSDVKKINIILPPLYEQKRIAEFLDKKCSEIDSLTADIQSEIEILEAYKRSNITEAVTKGLDRNVSMKESGVEWLGKIPEHWDISRIGSIYRLRNTKVNDRDYKPLSVTMKGVVPQLDTAAKTNAHDDRKLVRKGDFVINSRSDRRGSCGISSLDGSVSLINTVLAPLDEMNAEYYGWLFHTVQFADEFYKWGHGIVDDLWTTGWQDMKKIIIPYPPLQEQECIAKHLNDKCEEIDKVLDYKKEQLEVLADYKKSVIYEYVTGKKEVI